MSHKIVDGCRRHARTAVAGLVVGLAAIGGSASALVIDNFEQGSFNLNAPAGATAGGTQIGLQSFNCISGVREALVASFNASQGAGATLNLSNVDDEVATVMPDGGGSLALGYDIGAPTDITLGDQLDRIRVWVPVAPVAAAAGEIRIKIRDITGVEETVGAVFSGPGDVDIFYASYTLVDLRNTDRIDVTLTAFDVGDYHIRDIRATWVGTTTIVWQPSEDEMSVWGPPFPIVLWWHGMAQDETGDDIPTGDATLALMEAMVPDPCDPFCEGIPLRMETGMPAELARVAETELWWNGDPDGPLPAENLLNFDLTLNLPPEFDYGEPVGSFVTGPKGFMVEVLVDWMDPGTGENVATSLHHLTGEIAGVQPLILTDTQPVTLPGQEPRVNVQLCMSGETMARGEAGIPEVDLESPLFVLRIDGAVGEPRGMVSVSELAQISAQLTAHPSIMRSHTMFDLGAGEMSERVVEVFDVGGKRVRALAVSAGSHEVSWDGRTHLGSRAAAGVYFARLANVPSATGTRLVLLP